MGIMMGCPHFEQGTVASGARSPGMKTFVSHQPHVTIRNCSLMSQFNVAPCRRPTTPFLTGKNPIDNRHEMVFYPCRLNMKTTFATKTLTDAPVNPDMMVGVWQRDSRPWGGVGLKF